MVEPGIKQNRNILVTGGTAGLGRMIATGFAAAGDNVIICARTKADCDQVAKEISDSNPGTCTGVVCDLGKMEAIENLVQDVAARFGVLHTLVNNAGAVAPGPLEGVREEDWDRVVDINLKAVFFMTQKLAPLLRKTGTPDWPASVINIGSVAGARVGPRPHYPYTAAKAGLRYLDTITGKGAGKGDHINVNAIALGVSPAGSDDHAGIQWQGRAERHSPEYPRWPVRRSQGHRRTHTVPGVAHVKLHYRCDNPAGRRHAHLRVSLPTVLVLP